MHNRRDFLKASALASAGLTLFRSTAWPFGQTPTGLQKFIQPLPGLGPTGIPVAAPNTTAYPGCDYYQIEVGQFTQQFHPDLPPSTLRGYADMAYGLVNGKPNHRYLGGVIVSQQNRPIWLKMKNNLPDGPHPLPVDTTVMGVVNGQNDNRVIAHLHGGYSPWTSDGGPFAWYDPHGNVGPSFIPSINGTGTPGEFLHYFPNAQPSRLMWYHDHAVGMTRLNAYVGIVSAYLVTDSFEQSLVAKHILPANPIPLVLQDKSFVSQAAVDGGYTWGKVGDLWYPYQYEVNQLPPNWANNPTGRWDYGPGETPPAVLAAGDQNLPTPSQVPEYFSDTIVINGAAYPYLEVEPRHYRFRILNGSQARFYNLQLYYEDPLKAGEADLNHAGPEFIQIGTDGGFLPVPVSLNNPPQPLVIAAGEGTVLAYTLLLAPAERADLIIDFSKVPVGARLILYNDAPAPFPGGDVRNDYYTGAPDQTASGGVPPTPAGQGPNTRTLMQFRIVSRVGPADPPAMNTLASIAVKATGGKKNRDAWDYNLKTILSPGNVAGLNPKEAVVFRDLTLNEDFDEYGRLIQKLGTRETMGPNNQGQPTWGRGFMDPATECPMSGSVEVWRIFNLTGDNHPVHFHLVNVQLLSRQPFDVNHFMANNAALKFTGPATWPDENELGYKETVRMNPGEVTTVIMKFELPSTPFYIPPSPRTGGHEYVWHCHILEHEEHDMMRPLVVQRSSW
jgi:spore coat protein A